MQSTGVALMFPPISSSLSLQSVLVRDIVRCSGVLVTSYSTLVLQQELLLAHNWHYIVLDEGHKIRNPDVKATLVCKQVQSNLSKPYPDKTEHLPKPNDFRGPEFFPYYSNFKKN